MELKTSRRYEELDALRGIAALMVVFFHFTFLRDSYDDIFKVGVTGVDLFFVISGFVIFMSLQKISGSREFIINRVSRLYPTYWASVTFTFMLLVAAHIYNHKFSSSEIIQYLGNMTMFQYYLGIKDLDGPYWTMIIEMLFYICILLLYQLKMLKHLNRIGIVLCAVSVILTQFFYEYEFVKGFLYWFPLMQYIPLFFAGTVFYRLYIHRTRLPENYAIIIFCYVCQLLLFPYVGKSRNSINHIEYALMLTIFFTLFTLFINFKLKFIINPVTLFLGKISFALYLIHQYLSCTILIPVLTEKFHINFWVACVFIVLPIVLGIAAFITYFIEIPLGRRMKSTLKRRYLLREQANGTVQAV